MPSVSMPLIEVASFLMALNSAGQLAGSGSRFVL